MVILYFFVEARVIDSVVLWFHMESVSAAVRFCRIQPEITERSEACNLALTISTRWFDTMLLTCLLENYTS